MNTVPRVNLVIRSASYLGLSQGTLLSSLQRYVSEYLAPSWDVYCDLRIGAPGEGWELYLLDDDQADGTLGFHDVETDGIPRGFIDVGDTLRRGESVSVVASHELAEMLVNPACNRGVFTPRGRWIAMEICDPVQGETFNVKGGIPVSSFVYPSWFGGPSTGKYDATGKCKRPFELLPYGYIPTWEGGTWGELFGSANGKSRAAHVSRGLDRPERIARRGPMA